MVIFIMVVLALLLAALAYINAQSNQNTAYQIASTRAYWAAQSGAEWGAYQIAPATGSAASQCFSPNPAHPGIGSIPGLGGCSATVACSSTTTASTTSYQISSQGDCPAGKLGAGNSPVVALRSVIVAISNTFSGKCVVCINNCLGNYCILRGNTYYCFGGLNECLRRCHVKLDKCTSVACLYKHCGGTSSSRSTSLNYWLENP
jgi:MSHA biogenesis protein MshP